MAPTVLGLDIGGANLKAATADRRAVSVPFALWKQPDKLPAALAALVAQFPDATELAVTMTGELCDCFETKREGVSAILDAVDAASRGRRVRVWGTGGAFADMGESRRHHLKVASANWHALATYAGRFAPGGRAVLIDIGSTTTDIVPLLFGTPDPQGWTDQARLALGELLYAGVRRTPVCAVYPAYVCAELFATMQDVYLVLGRSDEEPTNSDTADGRSLTTAHSLARLARMLGGDAETLSRDVLTDFARRVHRALVSTIAREVWNVCNRRGEPDEFRTMVISGAGGFLARECLAKPPRGFTIEHVTSLNDELGPAVSACAPAYALAVLAAERPA